MVHFRKGSQVWQLVTLLSVVGEFPVSALHLLGNERVYKALIHKLIQQQTIRNSHTGMEMTCRLFTITGKGSLKTIRLYKGALPILDWLYPDTYQYYMNTFWNHRFPGDVSHRDRNHRVAEAVAMCMRSGIESRQYLLPELQNRMILQVVPAKPNFYLAKDLKKVGESEMNKTMFTRMVGAVFSYDNCYAVYNTRNAVMKWSGMGEFKVLHNLIEVARLNAGISKVDSAILFGQSEEIALKTLIDSDQSRRLEFRFDSIYRYIHFIPMDENGIRQLRIMSVPDWKSRLLELLFDSEVRSYNQGLFEYDANINGIYILSHLDGDIARLIRFREAIINQNEQFEILCFPHQTYFLREYLGSVVKIKTIDFDSVEEGLLLERRDLFER
ncbi:MAG: hypothetical protein NC177_17355 [Ruminococcus flavefaciens]|nr:hypothetical protein [Ruminococcus flavefaciens]